MRHGVSYQLSDEPPTLNMNMETEVSLDTFVTVCQTIRLYIPHDINLQSPPRGAKIPKLLERLRKTDPSYK
jgi:hypothetical protein